MDSVGPKNTSENAPKGLSRRTIMKGVAWSVPAIAFATAAPAMALSPNDISLTGVDAAGQRCSPINGVQFCVTPAEAGITVTVDLPGGLKFENGQSSAELVTAAGGCVDVPAINATGAAGTYHVTGTVTDPATTATATANVLVAAAPGNVLEFHATFEHGQGNPTTYTRDMDLTAIEGGIAGDDDGNSLAAVIVAGTVKYWRGDASGGANTANPATLAGVTGATLVDTFTKNNGYTGGVVTDGSNVWQWWAASNSATPTLRAITGISGNVVDVQSHAARNYVLTTTGVWHWATATSGTQSLSATRLTSASQHPIQMSSYDDSRENVSGVAVILGSSGTATFGQLAVWDGSGPLQNVQGNSTSSIRSVAAGSAGLAALNTDNDLYTYAGYAAGEAIDPSGWTRRDVNVSSVNVWGFGGYFGGLYVKNGSVIQMYGFDSYTTTVPTGMGGKTITQVFSSDGTYLALASDGTVFYWYLNNDHFDDGQHPHATAFTGLGNVVDLAVWGYHDGEYFGGGYVIQGSPCTA